jgi:hypothetical protein
MKELADGELLYTAVFHAEPGQAELKVMFVVI